MIIPAVLKAISQLQPSLRVQVLMTTHSPLVLASLEPHFEEARDQLFGFHLRDQEVEVTRFGWEKHGDATGWLVSEVFGLQEARSPEAEEAIERAHAFLVSESGSARDAKKIESELAALLSSLDPFWPQWRFGLERMKQRVDA